MIKRNPVNDADADILLSILKDAKIDEVVTYESMSKAIARNVRGTGRAALVRARRRAAREFDLYFTAVVNVGLSRMSDAEKVAKHDAVVGHIRRSVSRDDARLTSVDVAALDTGQRTHLVAARLENAVVKKLAAKKARDKLVAGVAGSGDQLPTAKAVAFLLGDES